MRNSLAVIRQRQKQILSILRRSYVIDLNRMLSVTKVTIRRSICALVEKELVCRFHGCVTLPDPPPATA